MHLICIIHNKLLLYWHSPDHLQILDVRWLQTANPHSVRIQLSDASVFLKHTVIRRLMVLSVFPLDELHIII